MVYCNFSWTEDCRLKHSKESVVICAVILLVPYLLIGAPKLQLDSCIISQLQEICVCGNFMVVATRTSGFGS